MTDSTNTIDKLATASRKRFQSATAGVGILTTVIVLSAILSAVFFWRHSATVFSGLPVVMATALGLAIGLIPSEGAFFGWKRIRATKQDMTKSQLRSSEVGLWTAVGFAVTNVIAIFISSFSGIPAAIQQLSGWIVFFALMLPIPTQFILYAWFVISEQSVVENHNAAKLNALAHAAFIKTEEARMEAVIQGAEAQLAAMLGDYGATVGRAQADSALRDGKQDVLSRFYNGPTVVPSDRQPADNAALTAFIEAIQRGEISVPLVSNSTHDTPRHDTHAAPPQAGQGQPNGPATKPLGRTGDGRP